MSESSDRNTDGTINIPIGEWVDVKPGQVHAVGTYVDDEGVLRSSGDNSCVVWHFVLPNVEGGRCMRKGIQPDEIVYDPATGAPWCPQCWPVRMDFYREKMKQKAMVEELFAKGREN